MINVIPLFTEISTPLLIQLSVCRILSVGLLVFCVPTSTRRIPNDCKNISISAPAVSGFLLEELGFKWSLWMVAAICFLYSPWLYFLRNTCAEKEKKQEEEKKPEEEKKQEVYSIRV